MLFTEPTFLFLFLPILLALYFSTFRRAHSSYGNWLLLIFSVIFYAKGGGSFTRLILGSIVFNYFVAIAVDRARGSTALPRPAARRWLAFAVAANLVLLGTFKYTNFFADNVNTLFLLLHVQPVVVPRVLLPIGISFFTFHAISYVVDVYRRDATAQKSPVHAALYLLLFPQLIAGPIIRYRTIADQLARRVVTLDDFAYGVRRFVIGLAKKVLIANVVAGPADKIFAMPFEQLSAAHAWLGVTCYTFQIYFDFSGYSDMAIGLGRMFGFRFPENFRWPYIAASVQEFWRRWHMSLSSWFRDYLYVPLGGSRVSPARTYVNLVTVFFLCGLWHGASWNFVVWGLWHGLFLVIERLESNRRESNRRDRVLRQAQDERGQPSKAIALMVSPEPVEGSNHADSTVAFLSWPIWPHLYTLLVVMIGWVFFRAATLASASAFLKAMAGLSPAAPTPYTVRWHLTSEVWLALAAGAVGSTPWVPALAARLAVARRPPVRWSASLVATATLVALLVASIMQVAAGTYNPFIYFQF